MTPEEARDRKALYQEVEYEQISPAEADAQLRKWGQEPFQSRPDPSRFDPMTETEWTLPMAAAWFIWRSADAVRDQWNPSRENWWKWVRVQKPRGVIAGQLGPRRELKSFGRATLEDVFRQAGLSGHSAAGKAPEFKSAPLGSLRSPYSRLKDALQSGSLKATWGTRHDGDAEEIPPEYWARKFDIIANPRPQTSRNDLTRKPIISKGRNTITIPASAKYTKTKSPSSIPILSDADLEELYDLPDLSEVASSVSKAQRPSIEKTGDQSDLIDIVGDENDTVFLRIQDVIRVERDLSTREYLGTFWDITQILGWIAYRKRESFRSLWKSDICPIPTYYEEIYQNSFATPDPVSVLKDTLMLGDLVVVSDESEITSAQWHGREIWQYPDAKSPREDVLKLWKEIGNSENSTRPHLSNAEVERQYKEILDSKGGRIGKNKAHSMLKERGATRSQVRDAADKLDPSAKERGRKKNPAPPPEK